MKNNTIPIFFSIDDTYAPYLDVALHSLVANASKEFQYHIIIMHQELSARNQKLLAKNASGKFQIEFYRMEDKFDQITDRIENRLRHNNFTLTIYFRLFIAEMFPQYEKGIYIDSDVVVPGDISELYQIDLGDNIIGGCKDHSIAANEILMQYIENVIGVSRNDYINSGVLLMNLKEMREKKFSERFMELLCKYHFDSVAPDQDYLNAMCNGRMLYLDECWDAMPAEGREPLKNPKLVHYNLFFKPWNYDVPYDHYFWEYAKMSSYYEELFAQKKNCSEEQKKADNEGLEILVNRANEMIHFDVTFKKVMERGEKVRI